MHDNDESGVFRSFALSLVTFEYLKHFQRDYKARNQVQLNNNQALAILLSDHKRFTGGNTQDGR